MTIICPLSLSPDVQNLLNLYYHHPRVFIMRIQKENSHAINYIAIWLSIEDGYKPTLSAFEIVKSLLNAISSTPYCVVKYFPS